jgi:hypothetical protein
LQQNPYYLDEKEDTFTPTLKLVLKESFKGNSIGSTALGAATLTNTT